VHPAYSILMAHSEPTVLVLGSGIAGLSAALGAVRNGASVTLATKATQPEGASTWWAQGGIAVARKAPEQFKQDIDVASSGTSDPEALDVLVQNADAAVRDVLVETLGVGFDTGGDGASFHYGREAAHSEDRILHVDASTGRHIHEPFLAHLAAHDAVDMRGGTAALELLREEGQVLGARLEADGTVRAHVADATILATVGIGALYGRSTNPAGATGDGIAMAHRAGAATADMEFVQFHPTVCVADGDPFLVSEAVRGEGAVLRNANGERFMPAVHDDAELAPRDVVARAVEHEHERTGRVVLDVSMFDFADTFPDLAALCDEHGVDPSPGIPVVPAEHFLCGGVDVDTRGRASLDRLYAVGECARTGVHGANRLASTSLLEGLVWGLRAGGDAAGSAPLTRAPSPEPVEVTPSTSEDALRDAAERLQRTMDRHAGLRRTRDGLRHALGTLRSLQADIDVQTDLHARRFLHELRSACTVARLIVEAAAANETSVGCHYMEEEHQAETGPR
jgi:L-aspartate oxidase